MENKITRSHIRMLIKRLKDYEPLYKEKRINVDPVYGSVRLFAYNMLNNYLNHIDISRTPIWGFVCVTVYSNAQDHDISDSFVFSPTLCNIIEKLFRVERERIVQKCKKKTYYDDYDSETDYIMHDVTRKGNLETNDFDTAIKNYSEQVDSDLNITKMLKK